MWSWFLALFGITGIFFVGKKTLSGWLILLFNECLWVCYALSTHQYGFIAASFAYGTVYVRSYFLWKKN